jgi:phage terminase large subunit-like protein
VNAPLEIRPNPGPQEAYLATSADMCFFGGAAGGGKTYATLLDGLRWYGDKDFDGILFRREAVDLTGPGKVWDEAVELFSHFGGTSRQSPMHVWEFPSGAQFAFTHLQHEKDKLSHQGGQYSWIAFEELTHFTETQFWYIWSRTRTKANIRPYLRATCNPDPDSWVRKMIDWWIGPDGYAIPERSGVIRYFVRTANDSLDWADTREELEQKYGDPDRVTSFTFILSRLKDNPKVDPSYRANLLAMPLVERERLLGDDDKGGNWNIREEAGTVFKRDWFEVVDEAPDDVVRWVRAYDLAATEATPTTDPDWTEAPMVGITRPRADGRRRIVIKDFISLRAMPGEVEAMYIATAQQDGRNVTQCFWQDPGAAGKNDIFHIKRNLAGFHVESVVASKDKTAYAKSWSPMADPRTDGRKERYGDVILVRGEWNQKFLAQVQAFDGKTNGGSHDDMIDAVSRAIIELVQAPPKKARAVTVRGV